MGAIFPHSVFDVPALLVLSRANGDPLAGRWVGGAGLSS
jgi:hypothetical protein